MLLAFAGIALAACIAARNELPFWGWLGALALLEAGLATVRRWRGWRVWAGLFSWLAIALSAMVLFGLIITSYDSQLSTAESVLRAAFGLIPGAVGIFALWAKRRELAGNTAPRAPSPRQPQTPTADAAAPPDQSLGEMAARLEAALRKPVAKTEAHVAPTATADGSSPETQAKSDWTPTVPGISCQMPFHLLQRVFVFASGDARELGGPALVAVLQDAAERSFEDIMKQAKIDMISKSTEPTDIFRTGQLSDRALHAMEVIEPALVTKHRKGEVRLCVRPFEDPTSGQDFAIFLFYNKY
jgi:hypothetical protein